MFSNISKTIKAAVVELWFLYIYIMHIIALPTIRVSHRLEPEQAQHFVWPGVDPNCLQRLPADVIMHHYHLESFPHNKGSNS